MADQGINLSLALFVGFLIFVVVIGLLGAFGDYDAWACDLGIKECPEKEPEQENNLVVPEQDSSFGLTINNQTYESGQTISVENGKQINISFNTDAKQCRAYILVNDQIYSELVDGKLVTFAATHDCSEKFTFTPTKLVNDPRPELDLIVFKVPNPSNPSNPDNWLASKKLYLEIK